MYRRQPEQQQQPPPAAWGEPVYGPIAAMAPRQQQHQQRQQVHRQQPPPAAAARRSTNTISLSRPPASSAFPAPHSYVPLKTDLPAPWFDASTLADKPTNQRHGIFPSNSTNGLVSPWFLPDEAPEVTALMSHDGFTFQPGGGIGHADEEWQFGDVEYVRPSRPWSTISSVSATSSAGASLSPVQSELTSDTATIRTMASVESREPSPLRKQSSLTATDRPHTAEGKTFRCDWAGCGRKTFATHGALVWHVKAEHLLVCPASGCVEGPMGSSSMVTAHVAVAHPDAGGDMVKEWQLEGSRDAEQRDIATTEAKVVKPETSASTSTKRSPPPDEDIDLVVARKRACRDKLQAIIERKAKRAMKSSGGPHSAVQTPDGTDSQSTESHADLQTKQLDALSFPLVWEHAVLPFLIEFIPKWSTPRHVISTTRGRTPDLRRINITTQVKMSLWRKITVAKHVMDILPPVFRHKVSFVFSVGDVARAAAAWARGLSKDHPDDICMPKNPYMYSRLCMGDSIGIRGSENFEESTATLGPCITIEGGTYWLGNFHPFLEAYQSQDNVHIEHPSPQDRARCIEEAHDVMSPNDDFNVGRLAVTSGLNLKTTRVSHQPYWEDFEMDPPLVVTDWALISASKPHGNALRRFPSEDSISAKQPLIRDTCPVTPGAIVISSGRTSGYQRGQICEIPAYVSGEENGTQRATREWFIEEPCPGDNEEAWIRGGIGVEGDSGAAVIDDDSGALVGQVWGRNRYWGPGPRHTFFTPISDVFDDIQEKCGQQTRPKLPQHADEADRFPTYPSCRQCYDLRTYLDSRRSSRMSLQSMIMGRGDGDQDLTSIEATSELATPRDCPSARDFCPRGMGVEEAGATFNNIPSPWHIPSPWQSYAGPGTPMIADIKSPYAQTLDIDDMLESAPTPKMPMKKRTSASSPLATSEGSSCRLKRQKVDE